MRAAIFIKLDPVSAEQRTRPGGQSFDPHRVGHHDAAVRSLAGKKGVDRRPIRMQAVADDLSVHVVEAERGPDNAGIPVMEGRHAIVHVRHTACAVCKGHHCLLIGGRGMPQRGDNPHLIERTGQPVILVMFYGQRHDPNAPVGGVPISPALRRIRHLAIRFRLGALAGLVQIWPLQMDAQNPRAWRTVRLFLLRTCHLGDVSQRPGQNLLRLGDRCRQKTGHALADYILKPSAKPRLIAVIGVKSICAVRVHVNESGHNAQIVKVHVHRLRSIRMDSLDPAGRRRDRDLRRKPVVYDIDPCALQYHAGFSFHVRCISF